MLVRGMGEAPSLAAAGDVKRDTLGSLGQRVQVCNRCSVVTDSVP
jgi:hypothetical protein